MPNRREFQSTFVAQLSQRYDSRESENIFYLLVDHFTGMNRATWSMDANYEIDMGLKTSLESTLPDLLIGKPVQQVIGVAWFFDLKLKVNEHVLIPRPETEELVDWILKSETLEGKTILDVGTGSGCIALALAHAIKPNANCKIIAWDLSEDALKVARENAVLNGLQSVDFQLVDVLNPAHSALALDVLVSNPPYILKEEENLLSEHVVKHEPGMALFVTNEDPLQFYKAIADLAVGSLNPEGKLYFECHESHAGDVRELLVQMQFKDVELKLDMQEKPRMIRALRPD